MFGDFQKILSRKEELEKALSENAWKTREEFIKLTREYAHVTELTRLKKEYDSASKALSDNQLLFSETEDDPEMHLMVEEEIHKLQQSLPILEKKLMRKLLPPDENEGRPVIVEIRAGTGGEEASLFAGELFRMYQKFSESTGLGFELLSASPSDLGGFKEVIFSIKGDQAWEQFKYESGTHRVQRVPVTEGSGRIHTSAVTVAIMAEPEEVDVVINPKDLRIDIFRSSGPGGQSVNTTDSAVRVTHLPTGLMVASQEEKSQLKNKQKAMRILRARLLEKMQQDEHKKRSQQRKSQVGTGDRSEKIRTYNFPQNRVTDHRINYTLYNLSGFMEGNIEEMCLALSEAEYKQQIAQTLT
ncbi:MAG: peptide chain release factor 1 [Candidatus Aureabacteria bacterium]|nr:peptide chain release factor 1 [Candidatus Auribacterota bacterium]